MSAILEDFNRRQIEQSVNTIPDFRPGDTLSVSVLITEGGSNRIQKFEGVCIWYRRKGIMTSCLLRKSNQGVDIELQIFLYSPAIKSISVIRRGRVRRAVLSYLRNRIGKAARIEEKGMRARKRATHDLKSGKKKYQH